MSPCPVKLSKPSRYTVYLTSLLNLTWFAVSCIVFLVEYDEDEW
jgi:hypothetical protein